jgi:hypothetical protein
VACRVVECALSKPAAGGLPAPAVGACSELLRAAGPQAVDVFYLQIMIIPALARLLGQGEVGLWLTGPLSLWRKGYRLKPGAYFRHVHEASTASYVSLDDWVVHLRPQRPPDPSESNVLSFLGLGVVGRAANGEPGPMARKAAGLRGGYGHLADVAHLRVGLVRHEDLPRGYGLPLSPCVPVRHLACLLGRALVSSTCAV